MSITFNYVKYDPEHTLVQDNAKAVVMELELVVDKLLPGRSSALARTALEECYMWIGKAIRDDQVLKRG